MTDLRPALETPLSVLPLNGFESTSGRAQRCTETIWRSRIDSRACYDAGFGTPRDRSARGNERFYQRDILITGVRLKATHPPVGV